MTVKEGDDISRWTGLSSAYRALASAKTAGPTHSIARQRRGHAPLI